MGTDTSNLSKLCSVSETPTHLQIASQISTQIFQRKISRQRSKTTPKTKPKTKPKTYCSDDTDFVFLRNSDSDDTDQKYNQQEYSKNEIQRVITQYNRQIDQATNKFTILQEKFHDALQQKAVLLQQLQDSMQHQNTITLKHNTEISKYKLSTTKLQQQLNKYNKQYKTEINKYDKFISNLQDKLNGYDAQTLQEKQENIKLKKSNQELQNRINILKQFMQQIQDEKTNLNYIYHEKTETFENEMNEYKQSQEIEMDLKTEEINSLKSEIITLNSEITGTKKEQSVKDEMNEKIKLKLEENVNELKSEIIVLKSEHEKEFEEKKEKSLSDTQRQMEIFYDECSKAKSLFLCCKTEWIDGKDMSFTTWLSKHLNDRTVQTLWKKLKSEKVNGHVFVSLLATTTMIYKTKLFQTATKTKDRPNIDTVKLKRYVEHLGVWCIRNKGVKTNERVNVCVETEFGKVVNEQVYRYKLSLTQNEFANNLAKWVQEYIEDQGVLENVI